ncbi:ribbon-helix-helix protein, CopG family [bacterium]|nr:MAG: ribbon-helix-helix protein, CopG family [bacterium]
MTFALPRPTDMAQAFYNPPSQKEKFEDKIMFMVTPSMAGAIDKEAATNRETRSDVIRRALELYYNPRPVKIQDDGFNTFTAPYLSAVPCGPWADAVDRAEHFTISTETADELEAQDGDVWVRADGQSMEGAGIMDGVLVLVRPYDRKTPRRGEIVLIQVGLEDGEFLSTLKRFDGMNGQVPKLLDGSDAAFDLPEGSSNPQIIGRAIGTLGRL